MNGHQKEKSREIKDIMRTDKFGRMTYKEARRKWREGVRAFQVGDGWISENLARLGYSRSQLLEVGRAYREILKYCKERNLTFDCEYVTYLGAYELRFNGTVAGGGRYRVCHQVSDILLSLHRGSTIGIVNRVLDKVNRQLQEFHFPSVKTDSVDSRIIVPYDPLTLKPIEPILGELIGRR